MFALQSNASKAAFAILVEQLVRWNFDLIDCQVYTDHLASFGATEWERSDFLSALKVSLTKTTRRGRWPLESGD
jgi:leucyl/phenylalanyl-tRNA--protein transferase